MGIYTSLCHIHFQICIYICMCVGTYVCVYIKVLIKHIEHGNTQQNDTQATFKHQNTVVHLCLK